MSRISIIFRFVFSGGTYTPHMRSGETAGALCFTIAMMVWGWSLANSADTDASWSAIPGAEATWPWMLSALLLAVAAIAANARWQAQVTLRKATHMLQFCAVGAFLALLATATTVVVWKRDVRTAMDLYLLAASAAMVAVLPYQYQTLLEKEAQNIADRTNSQG